MTNQWNTPALFTSQQFVNAVLFNAQVRDNQEFLRSRPFSSIVVATTSTLSTSFVEMTGSEIALISYGGNVRIIFAGSTASNTAATTGNFDIAIDTARVGNVTTGLTQIVEADVNRNDCIFMVWQTSTPPSAASHDYSVYWKTSAGQLTAYGKVLVMEIR